MKKFIFITFGALYALSLTAQDITISFQAKEASATIDSVQATNLATNITVYLPGNETLTLVNSTSGVSSVQNLEGSIFPNPCNGSATLQFANCADDEATIQILNASGQLVMGKKQALSAGAHSFSVKFPCPGIYIVLARTSNGVFSFREVSTNTEMQNPSLEYSGSTSRVHNVNGGVNDKSATTGKTLNYSTGNNIMYTLYSGKNSRVMVDQPVESKTYDVAFYECADKDEKNYKTVTIGTQTWMTENLAYLPSVNTTSEYSYTASRYYVYGYNGNSISTAQITNNYKTYGVLYNWPAALSACPAGWHLPSDAEWTVLFDYLKEKTVAGGKMKSTTGWNSPNTGATNESCFSALPGGYFDSGSFGLAGSGGNWWSSTESNGNNALLITLSSAYSVIAKLDYYKSLGVSVRCVMDVSVAAGLPLINTDAVPYISGTTATGGGKITSDGGANVIARGLCWSTTQNPIIENSKTSDGSGVGSFTSKMTGLTPNTIYFCRAYATNSVGTAYGDEVSFKTLQQGATITDIDGNAYDVVTIGTQTWMAENLKVTHYRDGTPIPNITDDTQWGNLTTGAYCDYNNKVSNSNTYGRLYNWHAVSNSCNIAPTGWHVATDAEWTILTTFLGGESVAGGKLKETGTSHWQSLNTVATNESGFTALPGGYRFYDGTCVFVGSYGYWWSSTESDTNFAWFRSMSYNGSLISRYGIGKRSGYSVRCVKD